MLRGVNIFCADPFTQRQAVARVLALFLLPLALVVALALWQNHSRPILAPPAALALWLEPLEQPPLTHQALKDLALQPPALQHAQWQTLRAPYTSTPQSPATANAYRAWLRITLAENLQAQSSTDGRAGVFIKRILAGGPWSAWANGQLLQTDREDWSLQWNTPFRVLLPVGAKELYLALPVWSDQGFALGSVHTGMADDINRAWQARELWMTGLPRVASIVALLLAAMTLPLALRHRGEPMYALLCANALLWCLANLQYFYDHTGNPGQTSWLGVAMDLSINWLLVLMLLFTAEFFPLRRAWLVGSIVTYGVLSTTMAVTNMILGRYDMFTNHYGNLVMMFAAVPVCVYHWAKAPTRELSVLLLSFLALIGTSVHSLLFVSSMAYPDHVHTFPLAVLGSFFAYLYAVSRRWSLAIRANQQHQRELRTQLNAQKDQLEQQHKHIAALELEQQLNAQRQTLLQDLHDGLGSNLTSALVQARTGALEPHDTVLLLQELAHELRQLSAAPGPHGIGVSDLLVELRQRMEKRLAHGALTLHWAVEPKLPSLQQLPPQAGVHLRALLNEAVANALKHSQGTELRIHARWQSDALYIEITDNGSQRHTTTAEAPLSTHWGLHGMHARAQKMGWELRTQPRSAPETGWVVALRAPLDQKIHPAQPLS